MNLDSNLWRSALFLLNFVLGSVICNETAIVTTEYGPVKGAQVTSALGRKYFQFNTIPYMKAPLGKLRFRDAEPPENWTEPFDATINRPSYITNVYGSSELQGQEDAGILTISTPNLYKKIPVAVYIHGGGFQLAYFNLQNVNLIFSV